MKATPCSTHRDQAAGWRCTGCGALLCPACTVELRVGPTSTDGCVRCRGLAERIRVRRAELRSFTARVPGAFGYPLKPGGILSLLGFALVVRVLQSIGGLGAFLASGVYWAFLFGVIVATWKGHEALEPPEFSDVLEDLVLPAFRGMFAGAIVIVPFAARAVVVGMAYFSENGGREAPWDGAVSAVLTDPIIWLLLLVSAVYLPAALLVASIGRSLLSMLDPRVPFHLIRLLGADYAAAVVSTTALAVAGQVAGATLGAELARIPFVGGVLRVAVAAYFVVVAARILGLLVYTRGDELGMGQAEDYLEPVLPGASPGGRIDLEPAPRRPRAEGAAGPATVAEAVTVRPVTAPSPDPVANERAGPSASLQGDPIDAALASRDLGRALALYRERQGARGALAAAQLYEIARGAAQAAEYSIAAHALHAAAGDEGDPVAPHALLQLARLYRGRLARPDAARQAFEALLARHPGTPAAEQARTELEELGRRG